MVQKANSNLRSLLKSKGIPLWKLGNHLSLSEQTIIRWFRTELDRGHELMIYRAIDEIEMAKKQERRRYHGKGKSGIA